MIPNVTNQIVNGTGGEAFTQTSQIHEADGNGILSLWLKKQVVRKVWGSITANQALFFQVKILSPPLVRSLVVKRHSWDLKGKPLQVELFSIGVKYSCPKAHSPFCEIFHRPVCSSKHPYVQRFCGILS